MSEELGKCCGGGGEEGCGFIGKIGTHGICPNCNGMVLSFSSLEYSRKLAEQWRNEEQRSKVQSKEKEVKKGTR